MKTIILIFCLLSGNLFYLQAQEDIHYNHNFSTATYYNPSFAGLNGNTTFSCDFNDCDFEHINPGVYSFYLSFDTYLDSIRSGVGLTAYYNRIVPHNGSASYIGAIYTPKFRLNENYNLSPSIKFGFIHNSEKLILSNNQTPEDTVQGRKNNVDLTTGILLNSKRFYAGFSVDHLLEPKVNYLDNSPAPLKRKYMIQLGYHYAKSETRSSFIHVSMLCQYQNNRYTFFASDYFVGRKTRYSFMGEEFFHRILLGAGYKLTDDPLSENGLYLGIGTQEKYLTVGLGFEISTSDYHLSAIETSIKLSLDKIEK
jgi:type IX secretion system PorP/SprF family membrane protein